MEKVKTKFNQLSTKYQWEKKDWSSYSVNTLPDGVTLPIDFKYDYQFPKNETQEWIIETVNEIPEYVSPIKNIYIPEDDE